MRDPVDPLLPVKRNNQYIGTGRKPGALPWKERTMYDQVILSNQFVSMKLRDLRFDGCRRCARVRSGRILARW